MFVEKAAVQVATRVLKACLSTAEQQADGSKGEVEAASASVQNNSVQPLMELVAEISLTNHCYTSDLQMKSVHLWSQRTF
jgi:hypothetical protein